MPRDPLDRLLSPLLGTAGVLLGAAVTMGGGAAFYSAPLERVRLLNPAAMGSQEGQVILPDGSIWQAGGPAYTSATPYAATVDNRYPQKGSVWHLPDGAKAVSFLPHGQGVWTSERDIYLKVKATWGKLAASPDIDALVMVNQRRGLVRLKDGSAVLVEVNRLEQGRWLATLTPFDEVKQVRALDALDAGRHSVGFIDEQNRLWEWHHPQPRPVLRGALVGTSTPVSHIGAFTFSGAEPIRYYVAITVDGAVYRARRGVGGQPHDITLKRFERGHDTRLPHRFADLSCDSGQCVLFDDAGTLWALGNNHQGGCAEGSFEKRILRPVLMLTGAGEPLRGVVAFVSGRYQKGVALDREGRLWQWGRQKSPPAKVPERFVPEGPLGVMETTYTVRFKRGGSDGDWDEDTFTRTFERGSKESAEALAKALASKSPGARIIRLKVGEGTRDDATIDADSPVGQEIRRRVFFDELEQRRRREEQARILPPEERTRRREAYWGG